ncbi:hypothetical protein [Pseudoponticoccus marisrubri]|uniref:hypothetical protein n=1 Tax=Pseudoponticoccus marisrubri TaxID=1685382 RepID=UPI0012FD847A|nr:hypothetical protein [Pseudoponticoccus marisrubri]
MAGTAPHGFSFLLAGSGEGVPAPERVAQTEGQKGCTRQNDETTPVAADEIGAKTRFVKSKDKNHV